MKRPECLDSKNECSLDKVFDLVREIKEKQLVKMDEIIYNCVIDACFRFGDYQKAVTLYRDMVSANVRPSSVTYGIMIKGYG